MSRRLRGVLALLGLAVSSSALPGQDSNLTAKARELAAQVDSLEAAGRWRTAVAPLDRLLELVPADAARLRQRGLFAAWSGDRVRGVELLRRAAALNPDDPDYVGALAEVLSWSPDTREEAAVLFRRVLVLSPGDNRARVGVANLLAWNGQPNLAVRGYDAVLSGSPDHLEALKGRAASLSRLGRHRAAARSVERAMRLAPNDPMLRTVADTVHRATASSAEVSGLARRRRNQLDVNRLAGRATGSVGVFKLHAEYERSALEQEAAGFRSEAWGGGIRIDAGGLTLRTAGRLRTVHGLGTHQWDGSLDLGWRLTSGLWIGAGASRSPIEETRRGAQGELDGGELRGVVHANLAQVTLLLDDLPGPFDAELTVQGGRYTGMGLEENQRVGLDTRVGLLLNGSQPWVRVGYGFVASRFDYNADLALSQPAAQRGGYFSPAQYWRHQGIVQLSQHLGARVRWEADGRVGREWVRPHDGETASSRNTAVVYTALTWRMLSALDLQGRFLYVNAFDAFEMKEFATAVKVYFP